MWRSFCGHTLWVQVCGGVGACPELAVTYLVGGHGVRQRREAHGVGRRNEDRTTGPVRKEEDYDTAQGDRWA